MENEPRNRSEWFLLVEEYQNSNLTQVEFCKQKNLVIGRFVYYLHIYRKQKNIGNQKEQPSFSEVTISHTNPERINDIKIELPNGFRCQVSIAIPPEALKKILGAMLSC